MCRHLRWQLVLLHHIPNRVPHFTPHDLVIHRSGQRSLQPLFCLTSIVVSLVHRRYMPLSGSSNSPVRNGSTKRVHNSISLTFYSMRNLGNLVTSTLKVLTNLNSLSSWSNAFKNISTRILIRLLLTNLSKVPSKSPSMFKGIREWLNVACRFGRADCRIPAFEIKKRVW